VISQILIHVRQTLQQVSDPATLFANIGSVAALAISGVALNLLIGRFYGFEGLGVFSQALLFFLILGQVAAGGFAFAALYHFSRYGALDTGARTYLVATLLPVFVVGALMALLLRHGAPVIGFALDSPELAETMPAVGLGVMLFGLNKVGVHSLNGMEHLKTYAVLQGIRMPIMLLACLVVLNAQGSAGALGWVFVASEAVIFTAMLIILWHYTRGTHLDLGMVPTVMIQENGRGWRGALIGLLADVNSKVDVLMLGLLASDRVVGIYALGAMFADGLRMLLAAIQSVINPRVANYLSNGDIVAFDALYASLATIGRSVSGLALLCGAGLMIYAAPALLGAEDIRSSTEVFLVMGVATTIAAPAVILNQSFTQAGLPGLQTAFLAILAALNLALNATLIPLFGSLGAATATGIAELGQLYLLARWKFRLTP